MDASVFLGDHYTFHIKKVFLYQ